MGCTYSQPAGDDDFVVRRLAGRRPSFHVRDMSFPMWVLPVSALMSMEGPPKHHQELLKRGDLIEWQPGMKVTFVSHQWLSSKHPDPKGLQLSVLLGFIKNLMTKKVVLGSDFDALVCLTLGS